jgi:hypothetical protein
MAISASGLIFLVSLSLAGCGGGDSTGSGGEKGEKAEKTAKAPPPTDPAGRAAHDFFAAMLQGKSQEAAALLTPQATEGLAKRNERFGPLGVDASVDFRVSRIARPTEGMAIVECITTAAGDDGSPANRFLCILLREVAGQWRVSGFAHETTPGQPMMMFDYETGDYKPITAARSTAGIGTSSGAGLPSGPGSPSGPGTSAAQTAPTAGMLPGPPGGLPGSSPIGQPAGRPSPPRNANEAPIQSYR